MGTLWSTSLCWAQYPVPTKCTDIPSSDTCSSQPCWFQKTQDETMPRVLNHQRWGEP